MAASTIFDVKLRYLLEDKATGGVDRLSKRAGAASKSTSSLGRGVARAGTAILGFFGARAAGRALVGFNANMEDARLQTAGMIRLATGRNFTESLDLAQDLVGRLQERAKKSVGTTADMVKQAGFLAQPVLSAGLGMKDLEEITAASVVAAKALGVQTEVAARDIDQALRGTFRSVDVFTGKLLTSMGFVGEEGRREFNALGITARAAMLKAAITQPAIAALAEAQSRSFAGVFSTFQDALQIFLGRVGLPLFNALTQEITRWNELIEANEDRLTAFATRFGAGLRQGFNVVRETTLLLIRELGPLFADVFAVIKVAGSFLAQNKGLLVQLVKGFLIFKGVTLAGRLLASPVKGLTVLAGQIAASTEGLRATGTESKAASGALKGFAKFTAAASFGLNAFAAGLTAAKLIADAVDRAQTKTLERTTQDALLKEQALGLARDEIKRTREGETIDEARLRTARQALEAGRRRGFVAGRDVRRGAIAQAVTGFTPQEARDTLRGQLAVMAAAQEIDQIAAGLEVAIGLEGRLGFQREALIGRQMTLWEQFGESTFATFETMTERIAKSIRTGIQLPLEGAIGTFGLFRGVRAGLFPDVQRQDVSVTINRIEVQSDDPDRFVFGMVSAFQDAAKNPSSAVSSFEQRES